MPFAHLKLKNQLCHRLYKASNRVARAYREPLAALDLTYPQYLVMMALWEDDQISIATLINKTSIDGGALTQILKKMTDKALITVITAAHDKRQRVVKLTQHGEALQRQASTIPEQVFCQFNKLDANQAQQLMQLLDLVVNDSAN